MRIDILTKLLQTSGVGVEGVDIFSHSMPAKCLQGVLVKLPLAGIQMDHNLPNYYNSTVQIIVRHQDHDKGEALVKRAVAALRMNQRRDFNEPGTTIFAMRINYLLPKHLPIRFPRSDGNGIEWSVNFMTSFVLAG